MKLLLGLIFIFFLFGVSSNAQENITFSKLMHNKIESSKIILESKFQYQKNLSSVHINLETISYDKGKKKRPKTKHRFSNRGLNAGLSYCYIPSNSSHGIPGFEIGTSFTYYFTNIFGIRTGINFSKITLILDKGNRSGGGRNIPFEWESISVPIDIVYTGKKQFSLHLELGFRIFFPLNDNFTYYDWDYATQDTILRTLEFVDIGVAFEGFIGFNYRATDKINALIGLQMSASGKTTINNPYNSSNSWTGFKIGVNYKFKEL